MADKKRTRLDAPPVGQKVSRLAGLGGSDGQSGKFSWTWVHSQLLADVVLAVTRQGGLASFGLTRDGGAGTVTVFLDDDKTTIYLKPGEDVEGKLGDVVTYLNAL